MKSLLMSTWAERFGWALLILLLAAFFRFHDIVVIPPGMTHDEADHGLTAWQIASEGLRELYFTIGYGREPLYDYAVALFMSFMGPGILAGRLVSLYASILMIAAMMAWVRLAFGRPTALLSGAGLAVGFWPVMSGRQALRSVLLPTLFTLAILLFWLALKRVGEGTGAAKGGWRGGLFLFGAAGAILGLTFYTYIPARALWIVFPLLIPYWLVNDRRLARLLWWRIGVMLLAMAVVAAPLLFYLWANPAAEARIEQLAQPLLMAQEGEWHSLAQEASASLRLFFIEGDPTWRYNIAERPFLNPLFGLLLLLGLAAVVWRAAVQRDSFEGSASFLSLSWLVAGFAPVLITGPTLSMTQAIAVQPLVYFLPALALATGGAWLVPRTGASKPVLYRLGPVLLYAALALTTWRDYFQIWANHPEVRVQYETALVTALAYLDRYGKGEVILSTVTPAPYHSPAVAQMALENDALNLRWFDGRGSLLLPRQESATMVVPGFTPLPAALAPYFGSAELSLTLPMRPSDRDRPLRLYTLNQSAMIDDWRERLTPLEARFGECVDLAGYDLQPARAKPGRQVNVITHWRARQPLSEAVIFSHLLGADGLPVAQADRLDLPGESWVSGDDFLQLHQLTVPPDLTPGTYQVAVGVYTAADGRRLPLADGGAGDLLPLASLVVQP